MDEDVAALLLKEFPKKEFEKFAERFAVFLERLANDLKKNVR